MSRTLQRRFSTTASLPVRLGLVALLLLVVSGCERDKGLIDVPVIAAKTPMERRETLDALKAAWYSRPDRISPEHERAERYFLNRLSAFVQRSRGKESYGDACRLWNFCYRDHAARYGDIASNSGQP